MMTRRGIAIALASGSIAAAGSSYLMDDGKPTPSPRPRNNQCPYCRVMARPYVVSPEVTDAPMSRVTRCRNCNAAFFQDLEITK